MVTESGSVMEVEPILEDVIDTEDFSARWARYRVEETNCKDSYQDASPWSTLDLDNPPPSRAASHRPYAPNQVLINVYEVAGFGRVNRLMASQEVPIGGAMHAGVEVYGHEWSYGGGHGRGSGVICEPPRQNKQHRFRETVVMPPTDLTHAQVAEVVGELLDLWPAEQYHWLRRNCLTFANELCERLGVGRMPAWIDRFARGAGAVDRGVSMVAESAMGVAEGARFIMSVLYGAGVCGQCTKMPAATSLSLNVVEQLAATGTAKPSSRKGPMTPGMRRGLRRLSPDRVLETGAFAPRPSQGDGDSLAPHGGASPSSPARCARIEAEPDSPDGRCSGGSPRVATETPALRPAAALRARPDSAALSRRQVPPVPMIGMTQHPRSPRQSSPRERASPCSARPSPRSLCGELPHLTGRAAAPPTMRRDWHHSPSPSGSSPRRCSCSPPPPPRA